LIRLNFYDIKPKLEVNELERTQVLQDPGAMNFVFWQGKPAVVRPQEVEALKTEMQDFVIPEAQVGDCIMIEHGAFKGQEGKVRKLSKKEIHIAIGNLGLTIRIRRI
jgi:transcriptional antiterminator RfaH